MFKKMTLKDRILECLAESGKKKVELATATNSPRATITDWTSGKTKTLSGDKLLKASSFFSVRPEWLSSGVGKKRETYIQTYRGKCKIEDIDERTKLIESLNKEDWLLIEQLINRLKK